MKLECQVDTYESIFSDKSLVQVLNIGKIYCACESDTMVLYKTQDTEDWKTTPKKEFLRYYKKID